MQLIKRLKSLALAAIALAFAQTALAATFPGTILDNPCSPTDGVAYYEDGSGNCYKFTTWDNVLSAVGVGGDSGSQLVVTIHKFSGDLTATMSESRYIYVESKGASYMYLIAGSDTYAYTTFVFTDCEFAPSAKGRTLCIGPVNNYGVKLQFIACTFLQGSPTLYSVKNGANIGVDVKIDECDIKATFSGISSHLFAGGFFGDVEIYNSFIDPFINLNVDGQSNSKGEKPSFAITNCVIANRNAVDAPKRFFGYQFNGFKKCEVKDLFTVSGDPLNLIFCAANESIMDDEDTPSVECSFVILNASEYAEREMVFEENNSVYAARPDFQFCSPFRVKYDANGATSGTAPVDPHDYIGSYGADSRNVGPVKEWATPVVLSGSGLSQSGHAFVGWNTQANGEGTSYAVGASLGVLDANITLYAQYSDEAQPTGWYTITGIHAKDIAAAENDVGGRANIGKYIKTIKYPWYSGIHWITNVYDRVTADYAGGDLPTDDDAHPEVSWANCGGIITLNDGSTYTNQLQVTIFPKEGSGLLEITKYDYLLSTRDGGENYRIYSSGSKAEGEGTDVAYAKFIFDHCNLKCNLEAGTDKINEIPLTPAANPGIAFAMRNCHANCGFYVYTPQTSGSDFLQYPLDFEYSSDVFGEEPGVGNWHLNTGLWNGDFLLTNCTFNAKTRVSTQHCDGSASQGSLRDSFGGTTECVISNNTWRYVMPGYRIFYINRPHTQYIGENTYSPEGGTPRPITMDVKDNNGDGVQLLTNVTLNVMRPDDKPVGDGHYAVRYYVHGHEVKFVETNDESELDDSELLKAKYYVLDGDSLDEANFWSKDKWDSNSEKTIDLTRREGNTVPPIDSSKWTDGKWTNFDTAKTFEEEKGNTFKVDITYYLGDGKPRAAAPVSLHIMDFAQAANVGGKSYVYLAVKPTFEPAMSGGDFAAWLASVKAGTEGGSFKAAVSDTGAEFSVSDTAVLEAEGPHRYNADTDKGWVWMKVEIPSDMTIKYWKIAYE